ncbi:hypothetical protein ACFXK0_03465 [Nocardia sp. NPDC059177]|uniref:hypothetical protein n=1 Tax=Nocardia sp. NPDC059177 TaxID=3346759 RepID=UPI0036C2F2DB
MKPSAAAISARIAKTTYHRRRVVDVLDVAVCRCGADDDHLTRVLIHRLRTKANAAPD